MYMAHMKIPFKQIEKRPLKIHPKAQALWEKYKLWPTLKQHMLLTAKMADWLAEALGKDGIKLDRETLILASLLHDIGKVRDKPKHPLAGKELLIEEGLENLAKIVATHGYAYELTKNEAELPRTWEEKALTYADLHTDLAIRLYKERIREWLGRAARNKKKRLLTEMQISSAIRRWNTLVKEINTHIGVEEELLNL
jgi:putative nucleotidyltransferase with HDIG domain